MTLDTGTTAWLLAATALVMLMTPGVGFFYGGLVRRKNFISMVALSFIV
ncbi:MAG TPA: ammonium transporter, partial [Methanoregulaceae archaeon]|nr:ammonium transporter [Methanoregulaceae archaeon]